MSQTGDSKSRPATLTSRVRMLSLSALTTFINSWILDKQPKVVEPVLKSSSADIVYMF